MYDDLEVKCYPINAGMSVEREILPKLKVQFIECFYVVLHNALDFCKTITKNAGELN